MTQTDPRQALELLLRNPAIWRAEPAAQGLSQAVASGHAALDALLPQRGWPLGALTELLVGATGIGELSLLAPALGGLSAEGRHVALLAPPYLPQPRAWLQAGIPLERLLIVEATSGDLLWSAEQLLRSGECAAVVLWAEAAGRALDYRALQRLQLAAANAKALCLLYRPLAAETQPSPAPLRLRLAADAGRLQVQVLKCRGLAPVQPLTLQVLPPHWQTAADALRVEPARPVVVPASRFRHRLAAPAV